MFFFVKVILQEDPTTFCKYLSTDESLKEFCDVAKVVGSSDIPPIGEGFEEFLQIVSAIKILAEIKILKSSSEKMSNYLAERGVHREKISAKILSQKWSKDNFDPLQENLAVQNLLFDLLVIL